MNDKKEQVVTKMLQIAKTCAANAYAPYSKCHVGACVEAEDGTLFGGCNVENLLQSPTVCAEVVAITAMIAAGKQRIKTVLVLGPPGDILFAPCGRCRQVIREFASLNTPIYLYSQDHGFIKEIPLGYLLPDSLGPEDFK